MFGTQGETHVRFENQKKDKQEQIHMTSAHAVMPIADLKLALPFTFHFEVEKIVFLDFFPTQYVIRFVDKYLKVLLLCIISPHAP